MINLVKNEFYKVKYIKIVLSFIFYMVLLLLMNKYSDNDIKDLSFNLIPFIGIFTCLFFGGTINSEIDKGTFRYYLTKPTKRSKIYLSKILSSFIYNYISTLLILSFTSIIIFKIDLIYFSKYFTYAIPLYFLSSFIIYLSNKIKSTSFTICLGVLLFCFSLLLFQILLDIHFKVVEFTFLPYLDFSLFDDKSSLKALNNEFNIRLSLKRGVVIDTFYTFIFYFIGSLSFMKRDIKS